MTRAFLASTTSFTLVAFLAGCNGDPGTTTSEGMTDAATNVTSTETTANTTTTGDGTATSDMTMGTASTTTGTPTTGEPMKVDKRVFVTAATFHGNLMQQGAGADGLAGADALCQSAATAAGLNGTWIAWVSTSTVDAISRLAIDGRWTLVDGTTEVFAARGEIQLGPKHAIDRTEAGAALLPSQDPIVVWTNTSALGRNVTGGLYDACDDWTGQTGSAAAGVLFPPEDGGPGLSWTDTQQPLGCGDSLHLYCFEH